MGKHTGDVRRPMVITADEHLLDAVLQLAAAAEVEVDVVPDAGSARTGWTAASLVLLDEALIESVVELGAKRRSDVVILGRDLDDANVWRRAVQVGADQVAFLPDAAPWLVEQLTASTRPQSRGRVVTVVGGCGGAGSSTLAAALAIRAAELDQRVVLVDVDPLGGGIDLLLGAEDAVGVRWSDLVDMDGRVDRQSLVDALPTHQGVPFLSWSQTPLLRPITACLQTVLPALASSGDLVVVDLGRSAQDLAPLVLEVSTSAVMVVPARVRAVAAAALLLPRLTEVVPYVGLVVRRPSPGGLDESDITQLLDVPMIGRLPHDARSAEWEESGLGPSGRASWRRLCDAILTHDSSANRAA